MVKRLIALIFTLVICLIYAQKFGFEISGKATINEDTLWVATESTDTLMYEYRFSNNKFIGKADVKKQSYSFKGKLNIPQMLIFATNSNLSNYFFIEHGKNNIDVNYENGELIAKIHNSKLQDEYENQLKPKFNLLWEKYRNKREKFYISKDSLICEHIKKNPNSYVAFLLLQNNFHFNGYNTYQEKALQEVSKTIKNTTSYKRLKERIAQFLKQNLLELQLKNVEQKSVQIKIKEMNKKYILIDFWYSYCAPCIAQFPEYKRIYEKYKDKDFEIIGISTDTTKNKKNWEKVLQKQQLPWLQYLDENGKEAGKLNIHKFPTNFLVDAQGKIIQKDISPESLEQFLAEHLK